MCKISHGVKRIPKLWKKKERTQVATENHRSRNTAWKKEIKIKK